jgi:hypothetical protein
LAHFRGADVRAAVPGGRVGPVGPARAAQTHGMVSRSDLWQIRLYTAPQSKAQ